MNTPKPVFNFPKDTWFQKRLTMVRFKDIIELEVNTNFIINSVRKELIVNKKGEYKWQKKMEKK